MTYHLWGGFAILALVLFRVLWGLVGGRHARFRDFVQGPRAVMAYASSLFGRDAQRCLGHNPLGGWSILALLLLLFKPALSVAPQVETRRPYLAVLVDRSGSMAGGKPLLLDVLSAIAFKAFLKSTEMGPNTFSSFLIFSQSF